jgi:hypothetical protein
MSTPDDVLGWIRPPLEELRRGYIAGPGLPWEERRAALLDQLGLRDATQHPVVQDLLEQLDEASADDRGRILGGDELTSVADVLVRQHFPAPRAATGKAASDEPAPSQGAYDEQAWQAFLAQDGPRWTEEAWSQFRVWFTCQAAQQGLQAPAMRLLDYLTPQPPAERVTTLARYGVTITPPQAAAQEPTAAREPGTAEAPAGERGSSARDPLEAHPEFAGMSGDERMKVISDVLDLFEAR